MKLATYINMNGCADKAMDFYLELFKGREILREKYTNQMTDNQELIDKIFHGEIVIHDVYLYFCDTEKTYAPKDQAYKLTMECDSLEQAEKYFAALSENGHILMDFKKMPWGMYLGNVTDEFGVTWDIVYC